MFQLTKPLHYKTQKYQHEIHRIRLKRLLQMQPESNLVYTLESAITSGDFETNADSLIENLDQSVIGSEAGFWGPFGWKKYVYADHTASGKSVKPIENFIEQHVLPHYANTHTTVSHTSLQTTVFRDEAREIIKQSVGGLDNDRVIFCGSGSTSAVHKLVHSVSHPKSRKLIVFIGPFEHHSNILPWREAAAKIIQVPISSSTGQVDIAFLLENLQRLTDKNKHKKKNQLLVGCFSAGSNISGALTDDVEITKLLHKFGALAFWDYAAAAPHVKMRMNPNCKNEPCEYSSYYASSDGNACSAFKDAIFFSGHKFLGGPQTPGILVVKRHVLQNPVPHAMGGGTVLFTTRKGHHYLEDSPEREEGGTPDIVGSIRLGLVFRLRNLVGIENIMKKEAWFCRQVLDSWSCIPEIHVLGLNDSARLPIISFMIQHLESGYFLHHNFVVALLNDLFGIQCRGGCMCAGPYAQTLLNIDDKLTTKYEAALKHGSHCGGVVLKPGFVRISLSFHASPKEINFLSEAVKLVAKHGWKLLPLYKIDWKTASFSFNTSLSHHTTSLTSLEMMDHLLVSSTSIDRTRDQGNPLIPQYSGITSHDILHHANLLLTSPLICHNVPSNMLLQNDIPFCNFSLKKKIHIETLRWFMLPSESKHFQRPGSIPASIQSPRPFEPLVLKVNKCAFNSCIPHVPKCIPGQLARFWKERDKPYKEQHWRIHKVFEKCEFYPQGISCDEMYYYQYGNESSKGAVLKNSKSEIVLNAANSYTDFENNFVIIFKSRG